MRSNLLRFHAILHIVQKYFGAKTLLFGCYECLVLEDFPSSFHCFSGHVFSHITEAGEEPAGFRSRLHHVCICTSPSRCSKRKMSYFWKMLQDTISVSETDSVPKGQSERVDDVSLSSNYPLDLLWNLGQIPSTNCFFVLNL